MQMRVLVTVAIVGAAAVGAYILTRDGSGSINSEDAAIEAVKPLLAGHISEWRVSRVARVNQASQLSAVIPDIPAGGLTPRGFPGPVWVVLVSAEPPCEPGSRVKLTYIFEASSGKPLIMSGDPCFRNVP